MPSGGDCNRLATAGLTIAATAVGFVAPAMAQTAPSPDINQTQDDTVYLEADRVVQDEATGDYIASGNVTARYGDRVVQADELVFRPSVGRVLARGNIAILNDNGLVSFADEAEFDDDLGAAVIANFSTRWTNNAVLGARVATRDAFDNVQITRGFYTACQACSRDDKTTRPTWRIRARKVTRDIDSNAVYYRGAVLEVKGVPVAYSPFFSHVDPSVGRRSGLLLPNLGESSRTGSFYQQPYYWAISDSQDLTISPRFMTEVNPLIALEYRKKFFSGNVVVQGSGTFEEEYNLYNQDDLDDLTADDIATLQDEDGEFRGHVFADGAFRINENWTWGFSAERTTGDAYFERYEIPDSQVRRGLYRRASRRLLSQAYAIRQTQDSYASVASFAAQDLRLEDESELPIAAPFAEARRAFGMKFLGGRAELRANMAVLERGEGVDYRRMSVETEWNRRIVAPGGVLVTPFASARGDAYSLGGDATVSTGAISADADLLTTKVRAMGNAGVDISYPLGRRAGPVNIVIEPVTNFTVAPTGVNDDMLVNLDSQSVDLDEASLFNANRSTGFDLFEEGAHAAAGGRARVDWGAEGSASIFVGQSYRTEALDAFAASSGLDGNASDVVGSLAVNLSRRTNLSANVRVDDDGYEIQRLDVVGRGGMGPVTANVRYAQFDKDLAEASARPSQEINASVNVDISRNWSAYYRFNRDLDDDETRREFVGLIYADNCTQVELIYKNENFEEVVAGSGDSLTVRFTLATLGSVETR